MTDPEPTSSADLLQFLRLNDLDGGRKMKRTEAIRSPLTDAQIDRVHRWAQGEVNDPGIGEEEGIPPVLGFKAWTLLVMRLLWTINEKQGQINRARAQMAELQKALWIVPDLRPTGEE